MTPNHQKCNIASTSVEGFRVCKLADKFWLCPTRPERNVDENEVMLTKDHFVYQGLLSADIRTEV